jgi:outer membrane protein assembly factor BamB
MIKRLVFLTYLVALSFFLTCSEEGSNNYIGPDGGVVSGEGVTLTIPTGALIETHEFSFEMWFDYPNLPSCYKDISSRAVLINPTRLIFRKPVSIEMAYNNEDIWQSDPKRLILLGYDQINNDYILLGNYIEGVNDFKIEGDYPFVCSVVLAEFTGDWYQGPSLLDTSFCNYQNVNLCNDNFKVYIIKCSVYNDKGPVSGVELRWGLRPYEYTPFGYGPDVEISADGWTYKGSNNWDDWKFNLFITDENGNADCVIVVPSNGNSVPSNNEDIFYALQIWQDGKKYMSVNYHILWNDNHWEPSSQKLYLPTLDDRDYLWGNENNSPNQPSNPNPPNGALDINLFAVLSWDCSDKDNDTLKYDVYFGTSKNPSLVKSGITKRSYYPSVNLTKNTKYYWKIVASDGKSKTYGPLWSFTTGEGVGNGGNLIWKYSTGYYIYSSPFVIDNRVFIGSDDSYVYCLSENSGLLIWKYKTGDWVVSSPYVVNNRVYVGSSDYYIYCLSESNGSLIWKYETGGEVWSSPYVVDGRVYIGSFDNYIYCVSEINGSLIWRYKTDAYVFSTPYVLDGRVYIGGDDNNVYCLSENDGTLIWKYRADSCVLSSPFVINDRVYIGSDDYYINCLSASDGSLVWKYKTGDLVYSSPYVINGRVYVGSGDNYIYCVSESDGSLIWRYKTDGYVFSSPYVIGGRVYVGSADGYLYCLSEIDGALIWRYYTGIIIFSSPYVIDSKVFIGSQDDSIYCLSSGTKGIFN